MSVLRKFSGRVKRTQRYPQYSDHEMELVFKEISAGFCVKQSAARCKYVLKWVWNTMYSDDDTATHILNLSMVAGAKIKKGLLPVPDRWDKLYSEEKRNGF